MLKIKTLFALGKGISTFASILLVSFLLLACNNLTIGGGSLIISTPGARAATASSFTIEFTGSNGTTQNKTVSGGSTVQFDDLAPDTYTISVKGMDDAGTVVFSGSAKATVVAGKTATVTVDLQELLGSLTVEFTPAESTATSFTVEVSDSKDFSESKTVSAGSTVQFHALAPDTYTIAVEGKDADGAVVLGGASHATVTAGVTASATVNLVEGVGDYDSLQKAVGKGGTVHILKSIDVPSSLTVGTNVTIQAAYQDVVLKNTSSGNLFTVTNGNLTVGGGEHTITLDGNEVAEKSVISISGGTVTLASGIISKAAASGVQITSGTFNMNGGTITGNKGRNGGAVFMNEGKFNMNGGIITGNTAEDTGGGIQLSGGTFILSGGYIDNNRASNGSGIYMFGGSFIMGGSAVINKNNDVFLSSGKMITITETLTGATPVATITPAVYEVRQILSFGTNGNFDEESTKFAVTPTDEGEWTISSGFLSQVNNES